MDQTTKEVRITEGQTFWEHFSDAATSFYTLLLLLVGYEGIHL